MAFIEIYDAPVHNYADGNQLNGTSTLILDDTEDFPATGKVVFLDSTSQLQELNYTANNTSTNRLTVVAGDWTGTGGLNNLELIYENYYDPFGNTVSSEVSNDRTDLTEISSSQAVVKASTRSNNGATTVTILDANLLTDGVSAILFTDSVGDAQRLTYTDVNMTPTPHQLTGVTGWVGTGNLDNATYVYQSFGNTTFTEVAIS